MRSARAIDPKCFFAAWIFGWVTAIYLPSALIALTGLSPTAEGKNIPSAIFAVADEVAPFAKLGFGVLSAAFFALARVARTLPMFSIVALDMVLALAAMLLVLATVPQDWSRGFGVGLFGTRFAPEPTLCYAAGALLAGLMFSLSQAKCLARTKTATR